MLKKCEIYCNKKMLKYFTIKILLQSILVSMIMLIKIWFCFRKN